MAGFSNALCDNLLNHVFRTAAYAKPPSVQVGILRTMPTDDAGTGLAEVSGAGYARQSVASGDANWSAPSGGPPRRISNANVVDFGAAGADWAPPGTPAVGWAMWDNNGNFMGAVAFASTMVIQSGNLVRFPVGSLGIQLD